MKKRLADILQRLDQGGIEASCHATTGKAMRPGKRNWRLSAVMT